MKEDKSSKALSLEELEKVSSGTSFTFPTPVRKSSQSENSDSAVPTNGCAVPVKPLAAKKKSKLPSWKKNSSGTEV